MIKLIETENGLLIKLDSSDAIGEIEHMQYEKALNDESILAELLESAGYLGNGWSMIAPESIGALTSAPIIGKDVSYNYMGQLWPESKIYWFPNYQVESPIETLLEKGEVVFEKALEATK